MWNKEYFVECLFGLLIFVSLIYCLAVFFMSFFTLTDYYEDVIYASYLSTASSCQSQTVEEMESYLNSYGRTLAGYYSPREDIIVLIDQSPRTKRHEQCHQQQNYENRSHNCNHQFFKFLDEVECNIKERDFQYSFYPYNSSH